MNFQPNTWRKTGVHSTFVCANTGSNTGDIYIYIYYIYIYIYYLLRPPAITAATSHKYLFLLSGFARVENAEFYHMGQEGYINYEDPRFALSYLNTGTVSNIKPSYIIRRVCAAVIIELQLLFAAFSWDCIACIEACSLRLIVLRHPHACSLLKLTSVRMLLSGLGNFTSS